MFHWTTYNNLTCLQINVDTILFSNRQFDSFFDTTHAAVSHAHMHNSLTHRSHSPSNPQEEFLLKILKLRDLFAFYTSRNFTLFTQQHYFTENRKKEKKPLWHVENLI